MVAKITNIVGFGGSGGSGTITLAQISAAIGADPSKFIFSDATSQIVSHAEWNLDPVTKFSDVQLSYQPDNLVVSPVGHNWNVNIDPLQDSPNDSYRVFSINANLDAGANGFDVGTAGDAISLITGGFNYIGNGSAYGRLRYLSMYSLIGNGTDPVSIEGLGGYSCGITAAANATLDGYFSGYDFNLSVNASTISTSNFNVIVLSDFSQIPIDLYGYQGCVIQPNIDTIKNNFNFTGFSVNPTIVDMDGNSGFVGYYVGGVITNQGSGAYTGVQFNPQITHLTTNSQGLNVGVSTTDGTADWTFINITTGGLNTTGIVRGITSQISPTTYPGSMSIDSSGHVSLQVDYILQSGLGQAFGHQIGGSVTIPDGVAVTGSDFFGNGMSFGVDLGDAGSSWTASSLVGLTTLGFVGYLGGDGDAFGAINFCLNGFADGHNGHIDRVNNFVAAAVPGGGTGTMDEMVGYLATQPAGAIATDNWAFRADESHLESYMPMLAIGSMASKKVANASVLLDLDSTTQAPLLPRMTSTEEGAIATPLNSMIIYNTTTDKFRGYAAGAWVDLH